MAPKKKKGKKGRKKGIQYDPQMEVDRKRYEVTCSNLNMEMSSLKTSLDILVTKNEELEKEHKVLDEDKNDIIEYLKRIILVKKIHIKNLKETIKLLEEQQLKNKEHCNFRISEMQNEYKVLCEQLTTRVKGLEGRLSSLDELKVLREELMKKFDQQFAVIDEQKHKHRQELYDTEKSLFLEKNKIKQNMMSRLTELSNNFQDVTEMRIAATTQRVLKENVINNLNYDAAMKTNKQLERENAKLKDSNNTLRLQADLIKTERNNSFKKTKTQLECINNLTLDYKYMTKKHEYFEKMNDEMSNLFQTLQNLKNEMGVLEENIKILEQNSHIFRTNRNITRTNIEYLNLEQNRISHSLQQCIEIIQNFLRKPILMKRLVKENSDLLNNILTLLHNAIKEKVEQPPIDTYLSLPVMYEISAMGYVPKPVHLIQTSLAEEEIDVRISFQQTVEEGRSN